MPEFLTPQNHEIINVCWFNLLIVGVIFNVSIDNEYVRLIKFTVWNKEGNKDYVQTLGFSILLVSLELTVK